MASISISGVGSGIDFNAVRDAIINQRSIPIQQIQSRVDRFNGRTAALKELNLLLATMTNAAQDLTKTDLGTGRTATSVDPSIATVLAAAGTALGPLTVGVTRLASSLSQASKSFSSMNAPVLANGRPTATFQLRKGGAATGPSVTISSSNNTLAGLRDAINAANAGVTASIVDIGGTGTQYQLVLNSTETGANGRVQMVETTNTNTLSNLTIRNLNPPSGTFADLDASFSVNGLALTRGSNEISDAVQGLTISLKKVGTTGVEVARSNEIEEKLDAFVTAYNAVHEFIANQYKKDAKNQPTGILAGDSVLRGIQGQLSGMVNLSSADNGGPLTALSQIGITTDKTGKMLFDKDVLKERIGQNVEDVRSLLFGKTPNDTGIFETAYSVSNDLSDSISGTVQTAIKGYEDQVRNLNETIEKRKAVLASMRDILTRRFAAADAAIGQLNGQGTAIGNLMKSLQKSS